MNQWIGLLSGLIEMFTWGFDFMAPEAPTFAAEITATLVESAIDAGFSIGEYLVSSVEAKLMEPFARSKLAFKNVMAAAETQDLLMEVAQGYLDQGLAAGEAYAHWNDYSADTRDTILATACRQAAGNALRGDEDWEKLRRDYRAASEALAAEEPTFGFNVPDSLKLNVADPHTTHEMK